MVCVRECATTVCVILVALDFVVAASDALPPWELDECKIPSDPQKHPVSTYTRNLINLKKMHVISNEFWLFFSGSLTNERCELTSGVLYHVQRHNGTDSSYTYTKEGKRLGAQCALFHLALGRESYGFVSCAENEEVAARAAWQWWSRVPVSYIIKIMIAVACSFVLVVIVAVTVCIVRRRRAKARVDLPQLDMY